MRLSAGALRSSLACVGAAPYRDQIAVASHPCQGALVITLATERPGKHDVVHASQLNAARCSAGT